MASSSRSCGLTEGHRLAWAALSLASHMAMGGAQAAEIMTALGHGQLSTAQRYVHWAQDSRQGLAERAATSILAGMAAASKPKTKLLRIKGSHEEQVDKATLRLNSASCTTIVLRRSSKSSNSFRVWRWPTPPWARTPRHGLRRTTAYLDWVLPPIKIVRQACGSGTAPGVAPFQYRCRDGSRDFY
jgi:hypothetical protein